MDKLLIVRKKNLELRIKVTMESSIIKNPTPILWNYQGIYSWIPIETVKNIVSHQKDVWKGLPWDFIQQKGKNILKFNWHQAYKLRPDVGKMLEDLANDRV